MSVFSRLLQSFSHIFQREDSTKETYAALSKEIVSHVPQPFLEATGKWVGGLRQEQPKAHRPKSGESLQDVPLPGTWVNRQVTELFQAVLQDREGKLVHLKDLLARGPIVLIIYRGGWCPFCNLQFRLLKKIIGDIRALGAEVVAITPETPDHAQETVASHGMDFPVLSDPHNTLAHMLDLVAPVPDFYYKATKEFLATDLLTHNHQTAAELPVQTTMVIDSSATIRYIFFNEDFTHMPENEEIMGALRNLTRTAQPA